MKSFKQYLFHRIKATWVLTAVLCLFAIIITATMVKTHRYTYQDSVYEMGQPTGEEILKERVRISNPNMIYYILCGLCTVIPVLELGGLKNKRNADTMYSFPIDRRKMGAAHFLNGFLQILAVYLCMAVTASIPMVSKGSGLLQLQYLPPLMLLPIPAALLIYAYFSFLFNEANTTVDGCLFIASGTLIPLAIGKVISPYYVLLAGEHSCPICSALTEEHMLPYFPVIKIVRFFKLGLNNGEVYFHFDLDFGPETTMLIVWFLVGILSAIGFHLAFSQKREENIGDISSSWAGYKTMIPLALFCIILLDVRSDNFVLTIISIIVAILAYMLYRRSFKIKIVDLVSIGVGSGAAMLFGIVDRVMIYGGAQ